MFRASAGNDVIDQIKFAHDQGFTAWEHNSLAGEPPQMQETVGKTLADLDMTMGVFVAVRHLPPADHRGQSDPEHRTLLGRDRLLSVRRKPGPQGTWHGRDSLRERLPPHS
jgi:hypothetical protein